MSSLPIVIMAAVIALPVFLGYFGYSGPDPML